jgi:hypothetical protein
MLFTRKVKIRSFEKGFLFEDGDFKRVLDKGTYRLSIVTQRKKIDIVSMRDPWIMHEAIDIIAASGALAKDAVILDLTDSQRALVWVDDRFDKVVGPGLYALWTKSRRIRTEIVDVKDVRFRNAELDAIGRSVSAEKMFEIVSVGEGFNGVYFNDGQYIDTLAPGKYFFWRGFGEVKVYQVDMREGVLDISGQDIITADKVTLRMNTLVTYRVTDAYQTVWASDDYKQALYREAQLALRAVVGAYSLDALLTQKEKVAGDLAKAIRERAEMFGLQVVSLGIRDVILPGDMKELMNKVIEAKKAADANLIMRREETAAMRSQANTAKLLENNPTLMRMRELDVLEKIACSSKLSVVLGEKGLADRVVNLL